MDRKHGTRTSIDPQLEQGKALMIVTCNIDKTIIFKKLKTIDKILELINPVHEDKAKQCWCLIHDPDSLWERVLKERYFPNVSFLDAKRGGRASWAWASFLEGRDLILKGVRWQIIGG
ncbi:hypothetical protein TB1_000846 [Malus domestica]